MVQGAALCSPVYWSWGWGMKGWWPVYYNWSTQVWNLLAANSLWDKVGENNVFCWPWSTEMDEPYLPFSTEPSQCDQNGTVPGHSVCRQSAQALNHTVLQRRIWSFIVLLTLRAIIWNTKQCSTSLPPPLLINALMFHQGGLLIYIRKQHLEVKFIAENALKMGLCHFFPPERAMWLSAGGQILPSHNTNSKAFLLTAVHQCKQDECLLRSKYHSLMWTLGG